MSLADGQHQELWEELMKTIVIGLCALAAAVSLQNIAMAQQKTDVKLGVLADMSGIFSDIGAKGPSLQRAWRSKTS